MSDDGIVRALPITPSDAATITKLPPTPAPGATSEIKVATSNNFVSSDQDIPIEIMTDLIFEDIGGQEIINIARNTAVNGQDVLYQPIKNISSITMQYNPNNMIQIEGTSNSFFENFSLKLEDYLPDGMTTDPVNGVPPVYLENYTGDIIINTINTNNEKIEIQIVKYGSSVDDTIY